MTWIQTAQLDKNYHVISMHGNGDCFFEAVIAAFKSCDTYKNKNMSVAVLRTFVSNQMTEDIYNSYHELFSSGLQEKNADIILPFSFMRHVDSLETLKQVVKTSEFWANETAISLIERGLRVKFIIFSEKRYMAKQFPFIRTAEVIDETLDPRYYILLNYTGGHYDLVAYTTKSLFSLEELPDMLKLDIYTQLPVFQKKIKGWTFLANE